MNNTKFTYQKSGVNITTADKFVDFISNKTRQKKNKSKFKNIGGFGSITDIPKIYRKPKLKFKNKLIILDTELYSEEDEVRVDISPYTEYWGIWNDPQVPNTYSHYADMAMETLLQQVKPVMEKHTNLKLS